MFCNPSRFNVETPITLVSRKTAHFTADGNLSLTDLSLQEHDVVFCAALAGGVQVTFNWTGQQFNNRDQLHTVNMRLKSAFKRQLSVVDTQIGVNMNGNTSAVILVDVFRNASQNGLAGTPFDVSTSVIGANGSGKPNPGGRTPITQGAVSYAIGASSMNGTPADLANAGDLANFQQRREAGLALGTGTIDWVGSGAVDPLQYAGGNADAGSAWGACHYVLRPE